VWSLIIFFISEVLFLLGLDPKPQWGAVGWYFPPIIVVGGVQGGGGMEFGVRDPLGMGSEAASPKGFFFKNTL